MSDLAGRLGVMASHTRLEGWIYGRETVLGAMKEIERLEAALAAAEAEIRDLRERIEEGLRPPHLGEIAWVESEAAPVRPDREAIARAVYDDEFRRMGYPDTWDSWDDLSAERRERYFRTAEVIAAALAVATRKVEFAAKLGMIAGEEAPPVAIRGSDPLPCPFCGATPPVSGGHGTWYQVRCETFACPGAGCGSFADRDRAVARWNERAAPPRPDREAIARAVSEGEASLTPPARPAPAAIVIRPGGQSDGCRFDLFPDEDAAAEFAQARRAEGWDAQLYRVGEWTIHPASPGGDSQVAGGGEAS